MARDEPIQLLIVLGSLFHAALVTLAVNWAGASSAGAGFRIGGIVGFLVWAGVGFILYGLMDYQDLTIRIVDPLVEIVHTGIGGAVIAAVLARSGDRKG